MSSSRPVVPAALAAIATLGVAWCVLQASDRLETEMLATLRLEQGLRDEHAAAAAVAVTLPDLPAGPGTPTAPPQRAPLPTTLPAIGNHHRGTAPRPPATRRGSIPGIA